MSDIFVSYKREDQVMAKALANAFEASGWSVWWDPRLRSGEHFDVVLERELAGAKCVVVLWSSRSIHSQYVKDEATFALKLNKLVPVLLDDVELPFRFQGLHTLSLSGWNGSHTFQQLRQLLADIGALIGGPTREISATAVQNTVDMQDDTAEKHLALPPPTPAAEDLGPTQPDILEAVGLRSTSTYGKSFTPTGLLDQYSIKIYVGGFSGAKTADANAKKEIHTFMRSEGYSSYEISTRDFSLFPSSYKYTVQFKRD